MSDAELFEKFEALLGAVKFDKMDPEDFSVWAGGEWYEGTEGLRAFVEKYPGAFEPSE